MKTAEELKVLKVVAASLDGTSSQRREARAFVWGGLILGWVCMAGSMYLVLDSALSPFAGAAIAAFGGIVGGFAIFWSMSLTQWQVIKHHIDENSLNARIKEIETEPLCTVSTFGARTANNDHLAKNYIVERRCELRRYVALE